MNEMHYKASGLLKELVKKSFKKQHTLATFKIDAEESWQIILPTQNLERAYYSELSNKHVAYLILFDKMSKVCF